MPRYLPSGPTTKGEGGHVHVPAAPTFTQSMSVPITKGMKRTPSELQLMEEESLADYRDFCMFNRIVNGIRENHPTDKTLNNIIRTRHLPIRELSHGEDDELFEKYTIRPLGSASLLTDRSNMNMPSVTTITESDESPEDEEIFFMDL
jgi:hypothetical protein